MANCEACGKRASHLVLVGRTRRYKKEELRPDNYQAYLCAEHLGSYAKEGKLLNAMPIPSGVLTGAEERVE